MASYSTGADVQADELKRRVNTRVHNGTPAPAEIDNKKSKAQVCLIVRIKSQVNQLTTPHQAKSFFDEWEPVFAPILFTALAFFTRLWKIGLSPIVTWDEAQYDSQPLSKVIATAID